MKVDTKKATNILNFSTYDDVLNNIDIYNNLSIICFDDNFNFNSTLFNCFQNKNFDKLIIISNKKYNIKLKRLYISSTVKKWNLEHVKKDLLIIINSVKEYKQAKLVIKNLIKLKNFSKNLKINIVVTTNNILGGIGENCNFKEDLKTALEAINANTFKECYSIVYDKVCDFLDLEFINNNYCDFQNNSCFVNRDKSSSHDKMGCCYSFNYCKNIFSTKLIENVKQCEFLNCNTCSTKCITCKLFTCKSLKEKGISFNTHKILLLDSFFNKKQHIIMRNNFFKTKDEIITKLLEDTHIPYILYILLQKYEI